MNRPGGQIAARPLHFIWIIDVSGSMAGDKIQALNNAIRESIPHMQREAGENPYANVLIRAVTFSNGARWVNLDPIPVDKFVWTDVVADGVTDMGKALELVADQLKIPPMEERALPPVLVLISDGVPTDNFSEGLQKLMDLPWGKKAVKISIAIGADADLSVLQKFIGNNEIKPLEANNVESLVSYIKWASTAVLKAASSPPSQVQSQGNLSTNVPIPTAPPVESSTTVW
jgi:uncharacterized protein YegL